MSNAVKNIIIAFTILCAFVLVVFLIQLLVLNSGNTENQDTQPSDSITSSTGSPSPSPSQQSPAGTAAPGGAGANSSGSPSPSGNTSQDGSEPSPLGTRYNFPMAGNRELTLFVKEDFEGQQFAFSEPDSEEVFCVLDYKGNGTAGIELRYASLPDGTRAYAGDLLDEYVGEGGTAVTGEAPVRGSSLGGTAVTGEKDGMIYEAWVCSFADAGFSNTGVVIIIYYQNDLQKNALYEILDSLEMIPEQQ